MSSLEPVYTAAEVAAIEKVSAQTVALNCSAGHFPGAYRTSGAHGQWRIPESAVIAWRDRGKAPEVDDPHRIQPRNPRAANRRRRSA